MSPAEWGVAGMSARVDLPDWNNDQVGLMASDSHEKRVTSAGKAGTATSVRGEDIDLPKPYVADQPQFQPDRNGGEWENRQPASTKRGASRRPNPFIDPVEISE